MKKEIFVAGGCFWGVEAYFSRIKGIESTAVYYINGGYEGVSYKDVCQISNHVEAVKLVYDDTIINERELFYLYLQIVDPYSLNKQGNDIGTQYRIGIYTNDPLTLNEFKTINNDFIAQTSKNNHIELLPVTDQTRAEEYHQKYLQKNPSGYCHINIFSIPDKYLKDEYK
ncbi:peptide-methionine (S)-S-oxide reductase MsrA [Mycoplasmopsis cynos]|uniref:Peptide methionine sulfoxide reductase MsrA n=2 Tax=Mycoplasmopsis cynos TaxID=171284 RepID=L0RUX3_MYCC1|nr:peptide-methionine (S)-S-oxide reductase MsrA [Mycoplasmopsis cynos]TQC54702.1 peptide-methionine (S)-S-oxide reductase [Mycoplasmopsis cynos]UWV80678.1 peptide-methionine (S)-S-oxide reductase MsrA [Mycoplasmopsis cynos]WQQ14546.1 peptide-methionine (S)-S-oxide reductase MsrA [Mycoplasmopsis cynos]WQQ15197.1 peptide-methionine (S)-S-oxide reductase MsrA [Mycoplasmopsis cynos]WQQ16224.1 peptide-methionine (S)-S-oxide reductase MsrA [Mycoplasmopsis cynos]